MKAVSDERSLWLARNVLPHEQALRAWLQSRRLVGLDVDDIVQETYTRLILAQSVAHIRNVKTYAFQTAYSVMMDHLRRSKIVSFSLVSDLDVLGAPAEDPSPETQTADREELQRLAEAISALPAKVRTVFTLRRIDGLSQREVARRLGISESTVEKHISRGFLLLIELFGRGGKRLPPSSRALGPKLRRGYAKADRSRD
jgi:RNA polymerase sigma-70 factor (ECF subfamily)